MCHHIDSDRNCQGENIILAGIDLYAVGIHQAEPFLGDFGNLIPTLLDLIFMVKDVTLHIQVGIALKGMQSCTPSWSARYSG